ncbi:hypothetical protein PAXY110619_01780 [Paenibacillus xylanexedens]|uniref:Uncharacterized protein n=1 Tax=Paenibacillus xylanexedens TaxID=528191 RepID=A0ABS4RLU4_PAEXY|nr:hypothetical protein [Paenibacillus xylanexedens]
MRGIRWLQVIRKRTKTYSSVLMLNTSLGGLSAPAMYFSMFGVIHDDRKTVMDICPPRLNNEIYYYFLLNDTLAVNVLSIVVQLT